MGADNYINNQSLIILVTESSSETLNSCGEMISPVYHQEHVDHAGRTAPKPTGNN